MWSWVRAPRWVCLLDIFKNPPRECARCIGRRCPVPSPLSWVSRSRAQGFRPCGRLVELYRGCVGPTRPSHTSLLSVYGLPGEYLMSTYFRVAPVGSIRHCSIRSAWNRHDSCQPDSVLVDSVCFSCVLLECVHPTGSDHAASTCEGVPVRYSIIAMPIGCVCKGEQRFV